jgi:imidazolonepropionase-like amidohydrolase
MPGLIDAQVHLMFATVQAVVPTGGIAVVHVAATMTTENMLRRSFTSVRDLGGPVFGLKRGSDAGLAAGPRIRLSVAFISQSGSHGDFRLRNDLPARPGDSTHREPATGYFTYSTRVPSNCPPGRSTTRIVH